MQVRLFNLGKRPNEGLLDYWFMSREGLTVIQTPYLCLTHLVQARETKIEA